MNSIYKSRIICCNLHRSCLTWNGKDIFYVKLSNFNITSSQYKANAFTNDGKTYDYKFDCYITATLNYDGEVDDWGYVYEDPDGYTKHISLFSYTYYASFTDGRYAYYRNSVPSYVRLYGYILPKGQSDYLYDSPQTFELTMSKSELCPDSNHPHMIDLGLPSGTKWACCNVGSSEPAGFGDLLAWSQTDQEHNGYALSYDTGFESGYNITGTSCDAASVSWGYNWVIAQ